MYLVRACGPQAHWRTLCWIMLQSGVRPLNGENGDCCRKGIPHKGSRENRQGIVPVCGQVRARAPALLYTSPRGLHRRCAQLRSTSVGTLSRPFLKKNARTPETRIIPENAFCSFCSAPTPKSADAGCSTAEETQPPPSTSAMLANSMIPENRARRSRLTTPRSRPAQAGPVEGSQARVCQAFVGSSPARGANIASCAPLLLATVLQQAAAPKPYPAPSKMHATPAPRLGQPSKGSQAAEPFCMFGPIWPPQAYLFTWDRSTPFPHAYKGTRPIFQNEGLPLNPSWAIFRYPASLLGTSRAPLGRRGLRGVWHRRGPRGQPPFCPSQNTRHHKKTLLRDLASGGTPRVLSLRKAF